MSRNASRQPIPWPIIERLLRLTNFDGSRLSAQARRKVSEYVSSELELDALKFACFAGGFVAPTEEDERVASAALVGPRGGEVTILWNVNLAITVNLEEQSVGRVSLVGADNDTLREPVDMDPPLPVASDKFAAAVELARRVRIEDEVPLSFAIEESKNDAESGHGLR